MLLSIGFGLRDCAENVRQAFPRNARNQAAIPLLVLDPTTRQRSSPSLDTPRRSAYFRCDHPACLGVPAGTLTTRGPLGYRS